MKSLTDDRWLSLEEIAAYLGIKRDTVYKWINRKNMPAHKVGSLWKFNRDEIDTWVRTGGATAPINKKSAGRSSLNPTNGTAWPGLGTRMAVTRCFSMT